MITSTRNYSVDAARDFETASTICYHSDVKSGIRPSSMLVFTRLLSFILLYAIFSMRWFCLPMGFITMRFLKDMTMDHWKIKG